MNVDHMLRTLNACGVSCLVIGGMNFFLRRGGRLTYDIDLWIEDTEENRLGCERALAELGAEWGRSDDDWAPVAGRAPGWLSLQAFFCLTSPWGAIDIFRQVKGLGMWSRSRREALEEKTASGVPCRGLSDADMLSPQVALEPHEQDGARIEALRKALGRTSGEGASHDR